MSNQEENVVTSFPSNIVLIERRKSLKCRMIKKKTCKDTIPLLWPIYVYFADFANLRECFNRRNSET